MIAAPCRAKARSAVDLPAPMPPVMATATGRLLRLVARLCGGLAFGRCLVFGGSLIGDGGAGFRGGICLDLGLDRGYLGLGLDILLDDRELLVPRRSTDLGLDDRLLGKAEIRRVLADAGPGRLTLLDALE